MLIDTQERRQAFHFQETGPIRLLAILEATSITGPAKNLFQFARCARTLEAGKLVETAFALFVRNGEDNHCLEAAGESGRTYTICEKRRFDSGVLPRLLSIVREFQPDIIQSHAVKSHFLMRISGVYRRTPWVAFHHGYTWPNLRMRAYNELDRWSLRSAGQVLTVSSSFRDELVRRGLEQSRIEIIHNAIDPEWGAPYRSPEAARKLRERLGIASDERVILIVGRLSREKDHRMLSEAVHRLRSSGAVPHPRLLIVGDGPERERLRAFLAERNMLASVILTGQVPSAEPYYGIADVAVLSSRSEGSPNALLEAMASGTPVVATAVGGVPEIAAHGRTALLVPAGDCELMARRLGEVLTDEALARQLRQAAGAVVRNDYSPTARTRRLSAIYCRLARRGQLVR